MEPIAADPSSRKRKRTTDESEDRSHSFNIVLPGLNHPRSLYDGYTRDGHVCSESTALDALLDDLDPLQLEDDYVLVSLNDFEIYRSNNAAHPQILTSLNDLKTRSGVLELYFDGVLSFRDRECRVEGVRFEILAIDGYHDTQDVSVIDKICIQTGRARYRNVWYRLETPSPQYQRFHGPFLWLVDFVRHFVNYLESKKNVELLDFKSNFYTWLHSMYRHSETFDNWIDQCGRTDFRQDVAAHFEFLWKEAIDIDQKNRKHSIWKEVDSKQLGAIKQQPNREEKTIVTPYVFNCFRHMYFGDFLKLRTPEARVEQERASRITALGFVEEPNVYQAVVDPDYIHAQVPVGLINIGDIVGILRDEETQWKDTHHTWYAYVQGVEHDRKMRKILHVIWLYRPSDTTCSHMKYPYPNELFFSDNCNCRDGKFYATDVKFKLRPRIFPKQIGRAYEIFIRQTYLTDDGAFVTLTREHLQCSHRKLVPEESDLERIRREYIPGDTVLVKLPRTEYLEPCQLIEVSSDKVNVQHFLRRRRDLKEQEARPHEIVLITDILAVPARNVIRRCHVRVMSTEDARAGKVPPPYSYDGAGDCWLLTGVLEPDGMVSPVTLHDFSSLVQGFELTELRQPLSGLALFSGGGSFDRGLEEGGMVNFETAVDWDELAMHTYRANLRDPGGTALFNGSVNDHLAGALNGSTAQNIPRIGTVQFICGGSPCQGVSILQLDRNSTKSMRNTSLVASVVAYIDLYRPQYALFENVFGLRRNSRDGDENVFSQLICALVGMGYQLQLFNIDAWSYGTAQSRSRVFIGITAPGLTPWVIPHQTHSHPPTTQARNLGVAANGIPFGSRRDEYTPFDFATAKEATKDLPWLGDGAVTANIKHPDHRASANVSGIRKVIPNMIPRFPSGCGWVEALANGSMPTILVDDLCTSRANNKLFMSRNNKAFQRVIPHYVFPTITTTVRPNDARGGRWLHWDQNRLITVMEARRAQGIPDHEVLIGLPSQQWKVTGNGVARQVAVAFGMSLREACLTNKIRHRHSLPAEVISGTIQAATTISHVDNQTDSMNGLTAQMSSQTLHIQGEVDMPHISDTEYSSSEDDDDHQLQGTTRTHPLVISDSASDDETLATSRTWDSSEDEISQPAKFLQSPPKKAACTSSQNLVIDEDQDVIVVERGSSFASMKSVGLSTRSDSDVIVVERVPSTATIKPVATRGETLSTSQDQISNSPSSSLGVRFNPNQLVRQPNGTFIRRGLNSYKPDGNSGSRDKHQSPSTTFSTPKTTSPNNTRLDLLPRSSDKSSASESEGDRKKTASSSGSRFRFSKWFIGSGG